MTERIPTTRIAAAIALACVAASAPTTPAAGQVAADTVRLGTLQTAAAERDPRTRQFALLATQTDLRLRNIRAERRPTFTVVGQSQYQSDVTSLPFEPPGGQRINLPNDTYDARLETQTRIIDLTIGPRRAVERAQLAESHARVRTAIYALRDDVNDAFFSAARLQLERGEVEASIADLDAQLRVANDRVRHGAALPGEAATLQAEVLLRRQSLAEIDANHHAALTVLADLTGVRIDPDCYLSLPDAAADVARVRASLAERNGRPEYQQFARTRELLQRQEAAISASEKPRVTSFGRSGYGRPGLNALSTDFAAYWSTGVRVEWTPPAWGTTRRDRELLALQRQVVETEEAAFRERIERATAYDLATIDRLEAVVSSDDQIIALRERVARETLRRFQEGVVTSAEYVDRQTDVLNARLARASHHAELAQAQARFLTLVGVEVR